MGEFAPPGSNIKITKAQVKKYIQDMKEAQKIAKEKLEKAKASGEFKKEEKELAELEKKMDEFI